MYYAIITDLNERKKQYMTYVEFKFNSFSFLENFFFRLFFIPGDDILLKDNRISAYSNKKKKSNQKEVKGCCHV